MSSKPRLHGRDHRKGGADPIDDLDDYIRYDFLNGNASPPNHWLYVATSEPTPPASLPGMYLIDDGGAGIKIVANSGGDVEVTSDSGFLNLNGGDSVLVDSSGGGILLTAAGLFSVTAGANATFAVTGDTTVTSLGGITLTAGTSGATSPDGDLLLRGYDSVNVFCSVGDIGIDVSNAGSPGDHSLRVTSNAASPTELFRVDSAGHVFMRHLPIVDPATGDGQLWKNGQVVTVST